MRCMLGLALLVGCTSNGNGSDDSGSDGTTDGGGDGGGADGNCSGGTGWPLGSTIVSAGGLSSLAVVSPGLEPCAPLVVFAHAGDSPGSYVEGRWMDPLNTRIFDEAAGRRFVLLVPGVEEGEQIKHTWSTDMDQGIDALIQAALSGVDIDRRRIWMMGQSAGGTMTAWMTLYDPSLLTATAVVSAGLGPAFEYPGTAPDPKLAVYVAHDPVDVVVDYQKSVHLAEELAAHGHVYDFVDWDMPNGGHGWPDGLTPAIVDWVSTH